MAIQRGIAYKVWIKQIHDGQYFKQEGWDPNYVEIGGKQISRINILATVVGKFLSDDGNYGAITLDDGTDTIRSKAFGPDVKRIKPVSVGSVVRLIGKIKQYNEETYLSPEIVRVMDNLNWLLVQKLELEKIKSRTGGEITQKPVETKEEKVTEPEEAPSVNILKIIKELDKGKGAEVDIIIETCGLDIDDAKSALAGLLASGDIFEPKKGKLKVLE